MSDKTRRGNIVVIYSTEVVGTPDGRGAHLTNAWLAEVTSITREGVLKAFRRLNRADDQPMPTRSGYHYATIDMDGIDAHAVERGFVQRGMIWSSTAPIRNKARARRYAQYNATYEGADAAVARIDAAAVPAAVREAIAFVDEFRD